VARTSIDRRGNGRYRARYWGPDRRWHSRTFARKVDAQRWLNTELTKVERYEWLDPGAGRVSFGEVAERWMAGRASLRPSTQVRDRSFLNAMILPRLADKPVAAIVPSNLDGLVSELIAEGKAPATVRKAWQITSGVLRLAVRDRLIAASPAHDVRLPRLDREEPTALTFDELLALADSIDTRYRSVVLVGAFAGLRFGEIAGLKIADFDPLRRHIKVRRTVSDLAGRIIEGPPKTPKSARQVTLPKFVADELLSHLTKRRDPDPDDWIFTAPMGGPMRRTGWVRRFWKPALARAGLDPNLGTHVLRHTQVALLIVQREHPKVIADRLGHTSVRTVLDVYGHLYGDEDERVAANFERTFASYARPESLLDPVVELSKTRKDPR
jgi:integrase